MFADVVADLDACKSKCDNSTQCVSFEYYGKSNPHESSGDGLCQASSSCTLGLSTYATNEGNGPNSDLYIKGKCGEGVT